MRRTEAFAAATLKFHLKAIAVSENPARVRARNSSVPDTSYENFAQHPGVPRIAESLYRYRAFNKDRDAYFDWYRSEAKRWYAWNRSFPLFRKPFVHVPCPIVLTEQEQADLPKKDHHFIP